MSNEDLTLKLKDLPDVRPMGPKDPTDSEPVPDDRWSVEANPRFLGADIVGVDYKGAFDRAQFTGAIESGAATLQVREGLSNLGVSYAQDRVTASVGYTVGNQNANVTTTYDTGTGLAIGGQLKFGSTTVNFNDSSIGARYDFGGGISAGITGSLNGGLGVSFSGTNWGGGSGFSFNVAASNNSGRWSVDARFNLVFVGP
ncbi:hypothetical protein [Stenotrophomonas sp. 24(2023)]|uniref:hypothetical protein n=1 Tax=Stenotrophomonas sp. 24(2023) TaxID=3068324 RepID=UPI0027E07022|nr:hypothetical protein [Stenotrophomonas sp. 24(2023)]WMJ68815.1 hypothetical protein Q9R17_16760 [Stenotrophomonas sp. 24(2023)]